MTFDRGFNKHRFWDLQTAIRHNHENYLQIIS